MATAKRVRFITKRTKWLLVIWMAIFMVIQFFGPARTNPPLIESHTIRSQLQIPPPVANLLKRACMDCHSDETRWPWYSGVAPVRWWLARHVNDGRRALNLSQWSQFSPWLAKAALEDMAGTVERRSMPLAAYQALHPAARLSREEIKILRDWAQLEAQRLGKPGLDNGKELNQQKVML